MSDIILKESEGFTRDLIPPGQYLGICYSIIQLGTHPQTYQGETKDRRKVNICFELPDHKISTDKGPMPGAKSTTETLSFDKKANLRKMLENWRGRPFTPAELEGFGLRNVLGKPATIGIQHSDKGSDFISSVTGIMKGVEVPKAVNEPYIYSFTSPGENWDRLPNWAKDEIKKSKEWGSIKDFVPTDEQAPAAAPATAPQQEDDVPF